MCVSGGLMQAGAQISQGLSDAATYRANAKLAMQEGRSAIIAGESQAAQIREQGERLQSSTRAAQAASGVDLSYGSAAEVGFESAKNIEKDALLAGYQGRLKYAAKIFEAQNLKRQAKATTFNAGLSAAATILGTAEKAATAGMGGG